MTRRGEFGFDFKRFGVRVPAVLASPLIKAGTVFRVADGSTPLDHTSILRTVENRWGLPPLTARDAAAPDVSGVLTLATPRTDDPLNGVTVPKSKTKSPHKASSPPSNLQLIHAEMVSRLPVLDENGSVRHAMPPLETSRQADDYIRKRTDDWKKAKAAR